MVEVLAEVFRIEGFEVRLGPKSGAPTDPVRPYPYQRAADSAWTVKEWRQARWVLHYPTFGVKVLDAQGTPAYARSLLSNVRDGYEYECAKIERSDPGLIADILAALPDDGSRVTNSRLRSVLSINPDRYAAATSALKADGLVIAGRGRGGSLAITDVGRSFSPATPGDRQ
jgi:hypothetical protein